MKFVCDQTELNNALAVVGRGIQTRSPLPIATGVKVEAKEGSITLTATNDRLTIEKQIETSVLEPGAAVLPGTLFMDIIKKLPAEPVFFSFSGEEMELNTENSKFKIRAFSPEEFPKISLKGTPTSILLEKDMFIDMINGTSFAACTDESKGALTGIRVEIEDGVMRMIAIDGFRLAAKKATVNVQEKIEFVVPAVTMDEIKRIKDDAESILLTFGENVCEFAFESTKITARLFDLSTYNILWRQLIPTENTTQVILDTKQFTEGLDRASILDNLLRVDIQDDAVEITSRSEQGDTKEIVPAEKTGENLLIGLNSRYILDPMKIIDGEKVKVGFSGKEKPVVIIPADDSKEYLYLVLPVRLGNGGE